MEECPRRAVPPIRRTRSPANLLHKQPETHRYPRAEEKREQSAVSSCAQLLWTARMPRRVGTTPTELEYCSFGEANAPLFYRNNDPLSVMPVTATNSAYWLHHPAWGRR